MNWLRSSLRKWLGIGHEAELNNTVERLVARVRMLEANTPTISLPTITYSPTEVCNLYSPMPSIGVFVPDTVKTRASLVVKPKAKRKAGK